MPLVFISVQHEETPASVPAEESWANHMLSASSTATAFCTRVYSKC